MDPKSVLLCALLLIMLDFAYVCRWEMCGQVKVVVKIESEDDMLVLQVHSYCYHLC